MTKWKWLVRCTYNDTVEWPKIPGEIAIEVGCADDWAKDLEVAISKKRRDVDVEVRINPVWGKPDHTRITIEDGDMAKEAAKLWQEIEAKLKQH